MESQNKYQCWVSGQKTHTEEVFFAPSSFAARMKIAHKYRLETSDVVAVRVREKEPAERKAAL